MPVRSFKYAIPLIFFIGGMYSFTHRGAVIFSPLINAWVLIPLLELITKPDPANMSTAEEEMARHDKFYDFWLYIIVIFQYIALYLFLRSMQHTGLRWWETAGRIFVMGLLCGTFGINVGHELGHRANRFEQFLSKTLLLSSLYMHFFIEHNRGHHKRVSTREDPASARYGESVYAFYFRSVVFSCLSAWGIANRDMRKKGLPALHWKNEMLQYLLIQVSFIILIAWIFGGIACISFIAAATVGFLMLETVNYIEHYGLERKKLGEGKYERTMPEHSWNSNHVLGRLMLFELSRHSDHHYMASRKYQVLRHHEDAPQMPTGYPGMMILSLFPPAWFYVMHQRVRKTGDHSTLTLA